MDKGESLRKTAVRETREETGIKMTADDLYYKSERHRFEIMAWKTYQRTPANPEEGVPGRRVVQQRYAPP